MNPNTKNVIDQAIPSLLRRVPSLRARDVEPLRETLVEIAEKIEGTGAPVVAPLTSDEVALVRDSLRARIATKTTALLPGV